MHKKQIMDPVYGAPQCLGCGRGNTPDDPDQIDDFWVIDLERDVNWGDPAYLCKYCVQKLLGVAGYVDSEDLESSQREVKQLKKLLHTEKAEHDATRLRLKRIVRGRKAEKEAIES